MKRVKALIVVVSAVVATASADSGDRYFLHFDPAEPLLREWWEPFEPFEFENPAIEMTAEEVVITLHPEYARVEATFDFTNTATEPYDVEMCFPVTYGMMGGYPDFPLPLTVEGKTADLSVTIDGAETAFKLEDAPEDDDPQAEDRRNPYFPGLAVWPVRFEAGARRRVVCTYNDLYNGGGGMTLDYSFVYILATGSTWKGPIGSGRITVRPGPDFDWSVPLYYLTSGLPPARDDGDKIVWEFKDLEPGADDQTNVPPNGNYYPYEFGLSAGFRIGFPKPGLIEQGYGHSSYDVPGGPGAPAGVLANNVNFRTAPDPGATNVEGKPTLPKGEGILVFERLGDWYRVRASGERLGYAYVNERTGEADPEPPGCEYGLVSFIDEKGDRWTRVKLPAEDGPVRWEYYDEGFDKTMTWAGYEGWVRWRYADPETGKENIYVELATNCE